MRVLSKIFVIFALVAALLSGLVLIPNNYAMTTIMTNDSSRIVENLDRAFTSFYEESQQHHFTVSANDGSALIFADIKLEKNSSTYDMRADIKIDQDERTVYYTDQTLYVDIEGGSKLEFENVTSVNDAIEHIQVFDNTIGSSIFNYLSEYASYLSEMDVETSLEVSISPFIIGQKYKIINPITSEWEKTIVIDVLENIRKIKYSDNDIVIINKSFYSNVDLNFPETFDSFGMF